VDPAVANNGFQEAVAYARSDISRHPVTFIQDSIPDIVNTWLAQPQLYAVYGRVDDTQLQVDAAAVPGVTGYPVFAAGTAPTRDEPGWLNVLLLQSTLVLDAYWLLPIILLMLMMWVWRRPRDTNGFVMLALALSAVCSVFLGAVGDFEEFYRMRAPMDWAMVTLTIIVVVEAISAIVAKPTSVPRPVSTSGRSLLETLGQLSAEDEPASPSPVSLIGGGRDRRTGSWVHSSAMSTVETPAYQWPTPRYGPPRETFDSISDLDTGKQYAIPHQAKAEQDFSALAPELAPYAQFPEHPEISIVLPCLNEEEAIGGCIDTLQTIIARQHLSAEIVVVDNASTDSSAEVARSRGARVVYQPVRGYGNAYLKGFAEARGTYIVMADADNTYDLSEIDDFVKLLRQGYDLVMGNRFAGRMAKGAMTFSHRYIGNPILSALVRIFFGTTVRDSHCGMRAFTRAAYPRMRLRTGGMEFASEMVINASKAKLKIAERPISYAPRIGESKLHTVRDGWRHLRFMLLYSPTHLFLLPGLVLLLVGLGIEGVLTPGAIWLFGRRWDVHTMMLASVIALLGVQIIMLGLFARLFSLTEELDGERDRVLRFLSRAFTLERGLLVGAVIFALGFVADAFVLGTWIATGMGQLALIRPTVLGSTFLAIGAEVIFGSFFLSFLQFRKTLHDPAASLQDAASVRIPEPALSRRET
jgi:glycosyltransferase involved in cell wall biosynthesis